MGRSRTARTARLAGRPGTVGEHAGITAGGDFSAGTSTGNEDSRGTLDSAMLSPEKLRQLAYRAHAHPKSVKKMLDGLPVRGSVGARIEELLIKEGLLPRVRAVKEGDDA